jgi:hypothetical protein
VPPPAASGAHTGAHALQRAWLSQTCRILKTVEVQASEGSNPSPAASDRAGNGVVEPSSGLRDSFRGNIRMTAADRLKPPDRGAHWRATGAQSDRSTNRTSPRDQRSYSGRAANRSDRPCEFNKLWAVP